MAVRRTDPPRNVVVRVRNRDGWRCVRCGCFEPLTTQHRIGRGMGGSRDPRINLPANLITLCGSGTTGCHGWAESNPAKAREAGLALPRHADPETWPVFTWDGWKLLDNDGGAQRCEDTAPLLVPF